MKTLIRTTKWVVWPSRKMRRVLLEIQVWGQLLDQSQLKKDATQHWPEEEVGPLIKEKMLQVRNSAAGRLIIAGALFVTAAVVAERIFIFLGR